MKPRAMDVHDGIEHNDQHLHSFGPGAENDGLRAGQKDARDHIAAFFLASSSPFVPFAAAFSLTENAC
jgi:hypothetical protein